jgi:hypothetical protein
VAGKLPLVARHSNLSDQLDDVGSSGDYVAKLFCGMGLKFSGPSLKPKSNTVNETRTEGFILIVLVIAITWILISGSYVPDIGEVTP